KITDSLANNVPVELRNFGIFQPRLTKPRVGRNPNQPGSSFVIPSRATVKFKAGKVMRQRVEKLSRELKEAAAKKTPAAAQPNGYIVVAPFKHHFRSGARIGVIVHDEKPMPA